MQVTTLCIKHIILSTISNYGRILSINTLYRWKYSRKFTVVSKSLRAPNIFSHGIGCLSEILFFMQSHKLSMGLPSGYSDIVILTFLIYTCICFFSWYGAPLYINYLQPCMFIGISSLSCTVTDIFNFLWLFHGRNIKQLFQTGPPGKEIYKFNATLFFIISLSFLGSSEIILKSQNFLREHVSLCSSVKSSCVFGEGSSFSFPHSIFIVGQVCTILVEIH